MTTLLRRLPISFVVLGILLGATVVHPPRLRAEEPVARSEELDPFLVANAIFVRYARARIAGTDAEAELGAARAYAKAAPGKELPTALGTYVESWTTLGEADCERALRLEDAWSAMELARSERQWQDMIRALEPVAKDGSLDLDTVAAAEIHRLAAVAHENLGRMPDSIQHGRRSAEVAGRIGWYVKSGLLWHWTGRNATEAGEYEAARRMIQRAVAAYTRSGTKRLRPVLQHDLAIATYRTGRLKEALPIAIRARLIAIGAGDRRRAARILDTVAIIHHHLGMTDRAIQAAEQSIAEAKAIGNREGWITTMVNLAGMCATTGRYAKALVVCEEVLATPEVTADPHLYANAVGNLAVTLREMGRVDEAIPYLELGLKKARAAGLDDLVHHLELVLTRTLLCTDRVDRSPEVLQRILAYYEETENRWGIARALTYLAATYACLEREAEAMEMEVAALKAYRKLGDRVGVALVHAKLAAAHEKRHRWQAALKSNAAALDVYRALGRHDQAIAGTLFARARLLILSGDIEPAFPLLAEAMEIHQDLLHGLGDEDALTLAARARKVSDWGVEGALRLARVDPTREPEAAEIAYQHLESARAILLAEALANALELLEADLPPEVRRADAKSRKRVEDARRRLVDLATHGGETAAIEQAKQDLNEAWDARRAAVARVQRAARRVASITHPEVVPLEDLQASLDEETVFISYRFLAMGMALVVTTTDAALVGLPGTKEIRDAVRAYLRVVSTPELSEAKLATRLYEMLIDPLEGHLGEAEHLVISPDAELAYLPFAALLDAEGDAPRRLVERFSISMVPSATVLVTLRDEVAGEPSEHVLCVGDPVYPTAEDGDERRGLRRLPESGAEAREVAALFAPEHQTILLEDDASVAGLMRVLDDPPGRYRAIHFACHALVDAEEPRRSGLALSGGEMLDVDAILNARFPSCLVVLSACETARGKLAQGEGVMGFVRAFFHAGVPRVVASSWPISDASTRPLMRAFYESYVKEGFPPARALQRAQVRCIEQGGERAHPYHWAAFTLWGLDP